MNCKVFIVVLFLVLRILRVRGSMDSFQFDVNDILNEELMPAHLLAQELETFLKGSPNITREHFYRQEEPTKYSNFSSAFNTMEFHRKMMNEYLATNFLVKNIMNEYPLEGEPLFERRIGAVPIASVDNTTTLDASRRKAKYIPNEMLEDSGSARYRSWLDKTTTLDDIKRQFSDDSAGMVKEFKPLQRDIGIRQKSMLSEEETQEEEDFDDGDITGYAYSEGAIDSIPAYPQELVPLRHHLPFDATNNRPSFPTLYPTAGSKNGYYPPSGHENTYNDNNYGPVHPVQPQPQQQSKEIGLKDILDIALTTLAFLSFGMFILQVLMCITMNKDDTSNMMMMPMEAADNGATIPNNNENTEEIRRRKRNSPENLRIQMMNDLSRRVLNSIDAVLLMPKDEGQCHYRSLCENNKFARQQRNGQKIWIPMWSLGISWFSSKMPIESKTPILDSLKAAVIGLGNGDCAKMYRSCQMEIVAAKRERLKEDVDKFDKSGGSAFEKKT